MRGFFSDSLTSTKVLFNRTMHSIFCAVLNGIQLLPKGILFYMLGLSGIEEMR